MTSTPHSGGLAPLRCAIRRARFTDEASLVAALLDAAPYDDELAGQIRSDAAALVRAVRADRAGRTVLDRFLAEYGLSNQEGVALMCLAEALLRIPDSRTAERLIADKLGTREWASHIGHSDDLLVNASTWALMLTGSVVALDRGFASDPLQWMRRLAKRLGEPVIQGALRQALHILGAEFVLGRTIEEALRRSASGVRYSYDMLGEGARDAQAARRYLEAYSHAIASLANAEPVRTPGGASPPSGSGSTIGLPARAAAEALSSPDSGSEIATPSPILAQASVSVKLSALHPRYEFAQRKRVHGELYPRLKSLADSAAAGGIALTIDAEEADRLDLSLELFERLAADDDLTGWPGLGLAVQSYGKRALPVIDWLIALARATGRRIPVRLVKGAYWDAEIKHAQTLGHPDFPVFTRKANTDLAYLVCVRRMLKHPGELAAQFATHNAHTVAAVMALAEESRGFEFQRLHGMGESLYRAATAHYPELPPVRVYAPVGLHEDLLAYLVRRLLENGANASFVNRVLNERLPPEALVADPVRQVGATSPAAHPGIRAPRELYGDLRVNSAGRDLTDAANVRELKRHCAALTGSPIHAAPIVAGVTDGFSGAAPGVADLADDMTDAAPRGAGVAVGCARRAIRNPARHAELLGHCVDAALADVERAVERAAHEQPAWNDVGAAHRAGVLGTAADRLEAVLEEFAALLVKEAGKTLPDAVAEVREAVDFCRYYTAEARRLVAEPAALPGPTGESNRLSLHGRGVFVCISPWNFPLAIFLGQIAAALVTGNAVVAKPAEETPLIAFEAVRLLHSAGVPAGVLHLLTGDGSIGAALVSHPKTAGVAFTGSTQTAWHINRALAKRNAPIAPLIAETGGQNVMFVDSTALPEQVTDDVIQSAFGAAGQRCSALRVLYLQADIADRTLAMIRGAMDELRVGDPEKLETDVGPVISVAAAAGLEAHVARLAAEGASRHTAPLTAECRNGTFVAPELLEVETIRQLDGEQFGPILHVVRFDGREIESAVSEAMSTGYGLTLGLHSRIEGRAERLFEFVSVGNVYVNRDMVGAVVGSQPFGGQGLSGTGPKAGGPHYLLRFTTEKVLTLNTAAIGGNMELLSLDDG